MNPKAAPDYPYNPSNPFRTETQRLHGKPVRDNGHEVVTLILYAVAVMVLIAMLVKATV